MASSARRLNILTPTGGGGYTTDEVDTILSGVTMTRSRDGGDVGMSMTMKGDFRQYHGLDEGDKICRWYWDSELRFEGRVKALTSGRNSRNIGITLEGRAGVLREITNQAIDITSDHATYGAYFSGGVIDVGNVVKALYEEFIENYGTPTGFSSALAGGSDIDTSTGVYLTEYKWDGQSDLFTVMQGLARAAGYAFWGWLGSSNTFYFKPPDTAYPEGYYRFSTRRGQKFRYPRSGGGPYTYYKLPYIVSGPNETLNISRTPRGVKVMGGFLSTGKQYVYYKANPSYSGAGKVLKVRQPGIVDATSAEAIADNIFASYADVDPAITFRVRGLWESSAAMAYGSIRGATLTHYPWRTIAIEMPGNGTIKVSMPDSIVYHWDSAVEADFSIGNKEAVSDIKTAVKQEVEDQIDAIQVPYVSDSDSDLYYEEQTVLAKVTADNGDDTYDIIRLTGDGTEFGGTIENVSVSNSVTVTVDDEVQARQCWDAEGESSRTWEIVGTPTTFEIDL